MTAHPIYVGGQAHLPLSDWHTEKMRLRRRRRLVSRIQRVGLVGTALFSAWMLWAARAEAQVAYTSDDTLAAIAQYGAEQGVSEAYLTRVVSCETGGTFDPYSVGRLGELGAAQLHPRGELRRFYRLGYLDPFSPWQAIRFMAQRFAQGGSSAWSCA